MTHPDSRLTLKEAYEKHYDTSELSPRSAARIRHDLTRFESIIGPLSVAEIDNAAAAKFRSESLAAGQWSPTTINGTWWSVRALLRRLAKPWDKNPQGLSIIETVVPYMKPVRVVRELPRAVSLDDISRLYVACRFATHPRRAGIPSADLWRCLIVLAYTTGLRRCDLFGINLADIDVEARTLEVTARKTQKPDRFPLHDCAIQHIGRIMGPRDKLLPGFSARGGIFSRQWRELQERAGVSQPFTLHDIRRTAASEAEELRPGGGSLLLQHARNDVTGRFYLDLSRVLRDVIDRLPLPVGFASGPKMAARVEQQVRKARAEVYADDFYYPAGPIPADWQFKLGGFAHRGRWFKLNGLRLEVLKLFSRSADPLGVPDLLPVVVPGGDPDSVGMQTRVQVVVSQLRRRLRNCLGLEPGWDCLPCIQNGTGGTWTIHVPHTLGRETPHTPSIRIERGILTGAELRAAREAAGVSQYTLAARVGVSRSHVGDWESDRANIPPKWFAKLREALYPHLKGGAA